MMGKFPVKPDPAFANLIQERSGENLYRCYFCQKCSVGCPVAYAMDYKPAQVIKMVQLGMKEPLLTSSVIWLCVGCETCGTRCPNEINAGRIIDALRQMAVAEGYAPAERKVFVLHRAFLDSIRFFGRVHEATMLAQYKLLSRDLFSDLDLGARMLLQGKIPLLPSRIKRLHEVQEMFR